MKLKYYLRGLGIGIIVTTIILTISFSGSKKDIDEFSNEEVIAKATMLGMIMPEDTQETSEEAANDNAQTENDQILGNTEMPDLISDGMTESAVDDDVQKEESESSEEKAQTEETSEEISDDALAADEQQTQPKEPYRLVVNRGDVCRIVCEKLAAAGLVDDAETYRKYLSEVGVASFIGAGNYDIPYDASYEEIASILKAGPIKE